MVTERRERKVIGERRGGRATHDAGQCYAKRGGGLEWGRAQGGWTEALGGKVRRMDHGAGPHERLVCGAMMGFNQVESGRVGREGIDGG